ncbi:MAG: hypothetical protein J6C96_02430 [Oscillospiraceae bacterium]|nr:hypothetical protein [Oscillospiraceae bacterium]
MKQWLLYNIDKIYSFHHQALKADFRCDINIAAQAIAGMPPEKTHFGNKKMIFLY